MNNQKPWSLLAIVAALALLAPAFAGAYPAEVQRTGQTTCSTAGTYILCAGTGQDGDWLAGVPWPDPRFTDRGDGTVTDNLTGLLWAQNANLLGTDDADNDTDGTAGDGMVTWQHALDYIKKLNRESYLGYSDWRLPNVNELESLVNAEPYNPALPLNYPFTNVQSFYYWSCTSYAVNTGYAWVVGMDGGLVLIGSKTNYGYVWPVRSGQCGSFDHSIICLPRTGQTSCYDSAGTVINCAGTGQDGELQKGVAWPDPQFTDHGDNTTTDNLTGLMWAKNANLMVTRDSAFDTDGTANDGMVTWQHALDYVAKLNSENYLNHTDWRLPNTRELRSLADYALFNPALPSGHPFTNVQSYYYWSSTSYAYYTDSAWVVDMNYGRVGSYLKTDSYYVWPVRAGQVDNPIAPTHYIDNLDGTVTDTGTGLMWQQATAPGIYIWADALVYCESLDFATYTDWRLPTPKELASLIDTTRYNPAINSTYFPDTVTSDYWSSTTNAVNTNYAWLVDFVVGGVDYLVKTGYSYVRAVRSGQSGSFDNLTLWPVPDTGQSQCYDNITAISCPSSGQPFYGQDANYSINTPAYTKLAAGCTALPDNATTWAMVRDEVTSLVWEEKHNMDSTPNYADPNDADNTYTWFDNNSATNGGDAGTPGDGTDTMDFIRTLNTANYGGFSDWRMPTDKELQSLVDYSIAYPGPTINIAYFHDTGASDYWSSTTDAYSSGYAWLVYFGDGSVGNGGNKAVHLYVRAVRSGQSGPFGNLVIFKTGAGAGTVASTDGKINCGSDCAEAYTIGTEVTLTATAAAGSMFAGWSGGGCTGSGMCTVTMTDNVTVMADFQSLTTTSTTITTTTTTIAPAQFYADFTAAPVLGQPPLEVQFADASSPGASGHTWDFGDDTGGTGTNPTHVYKKTGVYTVSLTVAGPGSVAVRNAKVDYIKVSTTAPVADFTASVTEGSAPLTVLFTDNSTGKITGREWNFGDGETDNQTSIRHTFNAAGEYTVSLKVTGPDGTSIKTREAFITVNPGFRTSAVSGRVTGNVQAGITINLSGKNISLTAKTGTDGSYSFEGVLNGQYRVTPIQPGYAFNPPGAQVRVFGRDRKGIDFIATASGPNIEQVYTTPERVSADGTAQFSLFARVTHPDGADAIASVTADLTAIGGQADAALRDDAAAGVGLYTLVATVSANTEPGLKPLWVTARDRAGRARTAFVTLSVYKEFSGTVDPGATKQHQIINGLAGQTVVFTLKLDGGGAGGSPSRMSRAGSSSSCTPTVQVKSPSGKTYTGQTGSQDNSTGQISVEVPNAEAGTWTCQVVNSACTTPVSYGLESTIAGTGVVFGVVVDSRTGQGLGGISLQTTGGIGAQTNEGVYVMLHPSGMFSLSCTGAGFVSATRSVAVNAGSSTELNLALDNTTLTGSCFLTKALGEDSGQVQKLQRFRDSVLMKSAKGRRYIWLYYLHSPEIIAMMARDAGLAREISQCAGSLMPLVEQLLQGGEAMPDGQQRGLLAACLEKIRDRAQPNLRAETELVLKILDKKQPLNSLLR